tara:strand:- start:3302 stop:3694 length:393 start_codon:yes stop_codon:yes gene_type:complete
MIDIIKTWQAPDKIALEIIDLALTHIKKVELNPEVETEGDNFDYWNSYDLGDGNYIDYNIHCGDEWCELKQDSSGEYEYTDPSTWSWDVACYAVNPPTEDNPYHQIDTDREQYLFSYNKKGNREVEFENE